MEIILYTLIFIIGCFFGSFFTLAVYRIPRKEDILIKHSYCPNCNHKLGFLDLFPVFSYIFLGGKCRYCKTKIRLRYLILEIFSGLTFLLYAISLKQKIFGVSAINLVFYYIYISTLFIIAGIDKENINIEKNVLLFGYITEAIYIIYECILHNIDIYRYVMYLTFMVILLMSSIIILKKNKRQKYLIEILFLSLYMIAFCGSVIYVLSIILTLLSIAFYRINKKEQKNLKISIGFFMCISNILIVIITNFICNYLM